MPSHPHRKTDTKKMKLQDSEKFAATSWCVCVCVYVLVCMSMCTDANGIWRILARGGLLLGEKGRKHSDLCWGASTSETLS